MEFPELKGHTRRDYWLAIILEVLYVHRYINKYKINTSVAKDEAISKAVLGILRVQAIQELGLTNPVRYENILPFNLCDQLPGGDRILETLAEMSSSKVIDRTNKAKEGNNAYILCKLYFTGLTQFYVDKKNFFVQGHCTRSRPRIWFHNWV